MAVLEKDEILELSEKFESKTAEEVLAWALNKFDLKVALASSFGLEDVALIDMLCKIRPDAKVITLDTGYLFKEALELVETIRRKYSPNLETYRSQTSISEMERTHGERLFEKEPTLCCKIRKVEPLKKALSSLDAWITGIRRDQAPARANSKKIEFDDIFNLVKFNPLADWSIDEVWEYIEKNKVPYNVLHDKNYPSIGCEPCTKPVQAGEDPRKGRWAGKEKTECGLHLEGT